MSIKVGAQEMRDLAGLVSFALHDEKNRENNEIGFAVLTFDTGTGGMVNYISNCKREDMIKALKEFIHRNEANSGFQTPEEN